MELLARTTHRIWLDAELDEPAELPAVSLFIIFLQHLHVVGDVFAEDVVAMDLSVELSRLVIVTRETLCAENN